MISGFIFFMLILNREELSKAEMHRLAFVGIEAIFADDTVKGYLKEVFEAEENDQGT